MDANGGSGFAHYVSKCVQLQTHRQKILRWFHTVVLWYVHTTIVSLVIMSFEGGPLLYMALCIPLGLARTNEWSYGSDNLLVPYMLQFSMNTITFAISTAVGSHTMITSFGYSLLLFSLFYW